MLILMWLCICIFMLHVSCGLDGICREFWNRGPANSHCHRPDAEFTSSWYRTIWWALPSSALFATSSRMVFQKCSNHPSNHAFQWRKFGRTLKWFFWRWIKPRPSASIVRTQLNAHSREFGGLALERQDDQWAVNVTHIYWPCTYYKVL